MKIGISINLKLGRRGYRLKKHLKIKECEYLEYVAFYCQTLQTISTSR